MLAPLSSLLRYQNESVIARYEREYPQGRMNGNEAFVELLKYIWMGCKHAEELAMYPDDESLQFSCGIHQEMSDIDNMWHIFLLFTLDYQNFCIDYLGGKFFHHIPATKKIEMSEHDYELDLSRYLSYVYDNLGDETLIKWFGDLIDDV